MSEVETECIFSKNHTQILIATSSSTEVPRVLESCAIDDPTVSDK